VGVEPTPCGFESAAVEVAEQVGATFLVAFSQSGDTARRLSRYR
jgi:pyruvate kinase